MSEFRSPEGAYLSIPYITWKSYITWPFYISAIPCLNLATSVCDKVCDILHPGCVKNLKSAAWCRYHCLSFSHRYGSYLKWVKYIWSCQFSPTLLVGKERRKEAETKQINSQRQQLLQSYLRSRDSKIEVVEFNFLVA